MDNPVLVTLATFAVMALPGLSGFAVLALGRWLGEYLDRTLYG